MKTKPERMFELLRDVVRRGRDRNPNEILQLKAKVIRSPVAKTVMELEQVLTDWKYEQALITEADQTTLDEEHQCTILMTIIPGEFVEHMHKGFHKPEYIHNYTTRLSSSCSPTSPRSAWTKRRARATKASARSLSKRGHCSRLRVVSGWAAGQRGA